MIRVSATIRGVDDLARNLERKSQAVSQAVEVALEESAQIVSAEAQRLILDPPKTGRIYQKYVPRRVHQASAPGEAPANDLGHLAANIKVDKAEIKSGRVRIASLASYSKVLEFGGRYIAPRPFLRRALRSSKKAVLEAFRQALTRR